MPLTIKSFRRIRGLGVFIDHNQPSDIPDFRRYNLIYGFNGSGKTTLSRVLRCLELGALSEHFSTDGEFAVQFDDNRLVSHETAKATPNAKLSFLTPTSSTKIYAGARGK
jgi:wobble nucleotide-excising tRNase